MQFDEVIIGIGDFGLYQKRLLMLIVFPQILIACQAMLPAFILVDHKHWCKRGSTKPAVVTLPYDIINESHVPFNKNATVTWSTTCSLKTYDNNTNLTHTTSCISWQYDTSEFQSTPISDFDLVCGDKLFKAHASMTYMGGTLLGALILGALGDTFGRKPVMYFGALTLFGSSLACAWSSTFVMFAALRFISGTATITFIAPAMIIVFEMVGPSKRSLVTIIIEFAWCTGEVILCGLTYFIRDWRKLSIAISAPGGVLILYWFLLPESPRWLMSCGKTASAVRILKQVSKVNKTTYTDQVLDIPDNNISSLKDVIPLLKSPKLFLRWLIILFNWFVVSLTYYGFSLNVGNIGGNLFINFLISTVVEAFAYGLCLYINTKFGRKTLNCGSLLVAGVACLSTIFTSLYILKDSKVWWMTPALSMIGKMGVSAVFANMFIFSSELFPTTIRSFILASSNVGGRIGSTISPYIVDLGDLVTTNFGKALPLIIFGACTALAGILSFALPETLNTVLPENIHDVRQEKTKLNEFKMTS